MKIRSGYVSNSSSSSFLIAYDEKFYGDLTKFFENEYFGCETEMGGFDTFLDYLCEIDEDINKDWEEKVKEQEKFGKKILYLRLDNEYSSIISLLKKINEVNCKDKLTILYDGAED